MMRTVNDTHGRVSYSDRELYSRGAASLAASWRVYAAGSRDARMVEGSSVAAAVFPTELERSVYNNALLGRALDRAGRAAAIEAMERAYAAAGVDRYAAWVHEDDGATIADLTARGYRFDTSTRAMGMNLADLSVPRPQLDLSEPDWSEYLRIVGVPADFLAGLDPAVFHIVIATLDGESVATATAYDHDGDAAIFNIGTLPAARRRGLGTALTALQLHQARARGCATASIQSTEMAEGIYRSVGFRDLVRFLEYVPA
jgi:ribosomal protein S18 acetylase RimI-like enzyme